MFGSSIHQDPKCSLVRLDLGHNDFMESGADVLANALQVRIVTVNVYT